MHARMLRFPRMDQAARIATLLGVMGAWCPVALAQELPRGQKWVASWTASPHGPYPAGNPSAQPVLDTAFESPAMGAVDQTFRLIIRPDLWGRAVRLRFGNTFGARPVTFDDVFVGVQSTAGNIMAGTNRRVTFENAARAGGTIWDMADEEFGATNPLRRGTRFFDRKKIAGDGVGVLGIRYSLPQRGKVRIFVGDCLHLGSGEDPTVTQAIVLPQSQRFFDTRCHRTRCQRPCCDLVFGPHHGLVDPR